MWSLLAALGFVMLIVGVVAMIQPLPAFRIPTRAGGAVVAFVAILVILSVPETKRAAGETGLTVDCEAAVERELAARNLTFPTELEVRRDGFIVATYVIPDAAARLTGSKKVFGEQRLIAIREALLPCGFKDYRVNVNGTPPGTGLTRRYGSARFIDVGGKLEWVAP